MSLEIKVPDIGDFKNVEIIEVLIKEGDQIKKNDPVLTLESDKSSVEVPSPFDGKISSIKVKVGDKVSQGSLIAILSNGTSSNISQEKSILPETEKIIQEAEDNYNNACEGATSIDELDRLEKQYKDSLKLLTFYKFNEHKNPPSEDI
jgi:pyruvate dehydrogenase E1 component